MSHTLFHPNTHRPTVGLESGSNKPVPCRSVVGRVGVLAIWCGYPLKYLVVNFEPWLPHW